MHLVLPLTVRSWVDTVRLSTYSALLMLFDAAGTAHAASLLFTSNFGADNVGRVEILVDGRPADIGAADFTLEFWMRSAPGNSAAAVICNQSGYSWINGNIVFDRDRTDSGGRDFGLAIGGGRIVFGVETAGGSSYTICSDSNVLNGQWRHVAVQRRVADGRLWVHVDGVLEQEADGPDGNVSYPDGASAGSKQPLLVIAREKYDLSGTLGYSGWIDEIRLSTTLRYQGSNFAVPTQPFGVDAATVALYHLDEAAGDAITDENSNASPGDRRYTATAGPEWSSESPFAPSGSPGTLQLSSATYNANEGTATLTITATRAVGTAGAATVDLGVTGGSATSGGDYQFTPGMLSWSDGQGGNRTSTITIVNDTLVEGSETINLGLSNVTGATLGSPAAAVVTIVDNDSSPPPSPGVLQFSATNYSVNEGTATLTITVTRSGGTAGAASVDFGITGGTAASGTDYQLTPATLSWSDGQGGNRTRTITIVNDTLVEGSETINLGLSNVTGATLGSRTAAVVAIADNDSGTPSPGVLQFSAATYSVNEGTAALTITVARSGGTAGAARVDLGVTNAAATAGADYQFTPVSLSWNSSQGGNRTATMTIVNDTLVEGSETIDLELSNATGASLGGRNVAVVTITDNDSTPPPAVGVLQFSAATYAASESAATLTITVTRTGGSSGAASVEVTVSGGSATLNTDYQVPSTPLTWNDGDATERTLNISVTNDSIVEISETIVLALANVTGAALGATTSATATINDDDQSPAPPPTAPAASAPKSGGGGGTTHPLWILVGASLAASLRGRRARSRRAAAASIP